MYIIVEFMKLDVTCIIKSQYYGMIPCIQGTKKYEIITQIIQKLLFPSAAAVK